MKILLVGFLRIGEDNATGRTLQNLFEGMEDVSILHYCLNPRLRKIENPNPTVFLTKKESRINYYLFEKYGGMNTDSTAAAAAAKSSAKGGLKKRLKQKLVKSASMLRDNSKIRISKETYEAIDAFAPDLIYTLGGSIAVTDVVIRLSEHYRIPIVVHTMDDLISRRYSGKGLFTKHLRKKFLRLTNKMYEHSVCGIAIGEKMANEYQGKFNLPFYHAMNCIDCTHYEPAEPHEKRRIIFSGGVHGGRDKMLAQVASSVDRYNAAHPDRAVELEIYTTPAGKKQLEAVNSDGVSVNDYVPKEELFHNFSRADILLHVESFEEEDRKYFRLSMSTKLPEYMSVGRAIMVIGPEDVSSLEYVEKHNVGVAFHDLQQIDAFLESVTDEELSQMGKRALALAEKNHLRQNVQRVLKTAFAESVEQYQSGT
ncbi:MAG: hypothetical protein IJW49_11980 [Clostridia bacterium]|nr:hypothetical protein [Clostridia bacterium]MBQ9807206.1 hypothetical protein [Clostridia bacterium]